MVKHSYSDGPGGVRYFVRPPYKAEPKTKPKPKPSTPPSTPTPKPTESEDAKEVKTILKM